VEEGTGPHFIVEDFLLRGKRRSKEQGGDVEGRENIYLLINLFIFIFTFGYVIFHCTFTHSIVLTCFLVKYNFYFIYF
jgi:hypothetical protein